MLEATVLNMSVLHKMIYIVLRILIVQNIHCVNTFCSLGISTIISYPLVHVGGYVLCCIFYRCTNKEWRLFL